MSARDAIAAGVLEETINLVYLGLQGSMDTRELIELVVECHNEALTAAGFSIVHKDEIHAPSVERAIAVALAEPEMPGEPPEAVLKSMLEAGPVGSARASCRATKKGIAAALRELMKGVGR